MLRSMYTGISGMKGFQTKLDVVSNNIANVNTFGFKKRKIYIFRFNEPNDARCYRTYSKRSRRPNIRGT